MRATWLFAHAQRFAAQDRFEDALAIFERVAALRPRTAGVYLHWALTLSEADRVEEAVDMLQKAIVLRPANAVLPLFLGQILFDHGHYAEARTWCEKTLTVNPRQLRGAALLGLIDIALGDINSGCERLQQPQTSSLTFAERLVLRCGMRRPPALYQQISPMWQSRLLLVVESYLMQHEAEARTLAYQLLFLPETQRQRQISAIDRILIRGVMRLQRLWYQLRHTTQQHAWNLYTRAEEAFYLGQYQEAVRLYDQLDRAFPARQQVEERLYEIAYTQADFRLALQHWHRYLETQSQPQAPNAFEAFVLGELQLQKADYEGAALSLAGATDSPWCDYRLPYYQGLCHLSKGAKRNARRSFAAAMGMINPDIATLRLEELSRVAHGLTPPESTGSGAFLPPSSQNVETRARR